MSRPWRTSHRTQPLLLAPLRCRSLALPVLAALALPGCQALLTEATSATAGIGGASVADAVGANAATTTGIGLGVQALGRAGLQYAQRVTHKAAQDRIAATAGPLPVGSIGEWATDHTLPVEPNERGQVTVSRVISTGALECKEIVFSVDSGQRRAAQARLLPRRRLPRRRRLEMGLGGTRHRALGLLAMRLDVAAALQLRGARRLQFRRRHRRRGDRHRGGGGLRQSRGWRGGRRRHPGGRRLWHPLRVAPLAPHGAGRAGRCRGHDDGGRGPALGGPPRPALRKHAGRGEGAANNRHAARGSAGRSCSRWRRARRGRARQWFVTSACRQTEGWKWAAAEPATERWGSLH